MTNFARILSGAAGVAMVVGAAAPAAAQSTNYGGYNQGYNQGSGVVGQVLNSILGGGRYGAYGQGQDRVAVDRCARTAEAQVARDYRARGHGQYAPAYTNQGYGQGYGQPAYGQPPYGRPAYNQANLARVVGITAVERRRNGVKVSGVIDSGRAHRGAYGQGYAHQGYPNHSYPNQGYPNQGYNPHAAAAPVVADLRFSCRVDYRGYVSNVEIHRNTPQRRAY